MFTGLSLDLRDKRVDLVISNSSFTAKEIFYSPIRSWFVFLGLLLMVTIPSLPLLFDFIEHLSLKTVVIFVLGYLLVSYLFIAIYNRSFAITDGKLLVINAHFPFTELMDFRLKDISKVRIATDRKFSVLSIFLLLGRNYVELTVKGEKKRFYCLFLDFDCYDENWTEKTLDDLAHSLQEKGVQVAIEI